jgi:AraC family transcriptional regulator of adaptative response/methylated-DNA-[protein]-cysteine methyltransferase
VDAKSARPTGRRATTEGVCLLEFSDRRMLATELASLKKTFGAPVLPGGNAHLGQLEAELDEYFSGHRRSFTVPLVYPGTPFQRSVWQHLLTIPYGETRSYEQVATAVGAFRAVRAVGRANGLTALPS